jgi:hypothetical protein
MVSNEKGVASEAATEPLGRRSFLCKMALASAGAINGGLIARSVFEPATKKNPRSLQIVLNPNTLKNPVLSLALSRFQAQIANHSPIQISYDFGASRFADLISAHDSPSCDGEIWTQEKTHFKALAIFGGLPFSSTSNRATHWLLSDKGAKAWRQYFSKYDVQPIFLGCHGRSFGCVGNAVPEVVEGGSPIRLACLSVASDWYRSAGYHPIETASVEQMKQQFRENSIDLTAMLPHHRNYELGLHKLGKAYFYNDHSKFFSVLAFFIKKATWNDLPSTARDTIEAQARAVALEMISDHAAEEREILVKISQETRVVYWKPTAKFEQTLKLETEQVLNTIYKFDPAARQLCESYLS